MNVSSRRTRIDASHAGVYADPGEGVQADCHVDGQDAVACVPPTLVAIDGPAGSGKSSVSSAVAERLDFGILDTGAAYRALAWVALRTGVDLDDEVGLVGLLESWGYSATLVGEQRVSVRIGVGRLSRVVEVTGEIRAHGVSGQVSRVSKHGAVRDRLNEMFRRIVAESGLAGVVVEGRDITTVVAPDAPVRILMTASPEVRARRRAGEVAGCEYEQVLADILVRDQKDSRVACFHDPAPGVTLIDTSDLDFEGSVRAVIDIVNAVHRAGTVERHDAF